MEGEGPHGGLEGGGPERAERVMTPMQSLGGRGGSEIYQAGSGLRGGGGLLVRGGQGRMEVLKCMENLDVGLRGGGGGTARHGWGHHASGPCPKMSSMARGRMQDLCSTLPGTRVATLIASQALSRSGFDCRASSGKG